MTTRHTHQVCFGRKVEGCPRCIELANGAAPIVQAFWGRKAAMEAEQIRAIRSHNCKESGCGPVCTFGEW